MSWSCQKTEKTQPFEQSLRISSHTRERVIVGDSVTVELTVPIYPAREDGCIGFGDDEGGGAVRRVGRSNTSGVGVLLRKRFPGLDVLSWTSILAAFNRLVGVFELEMVESVVGEIGYGRKIDRETIGVLNADLICKGFHSLRSRQGFNAIADGR